MENFEGKPKEEMFDFVKSPLVKAYELLSATTPFELHELYVEEDQRLMHSGGWDYKNLDLAINKIKDILEQVGEVGLSEEEVDWRKEMLWFWYHHAISCAIWRYQEKNSAQFYATKALELQDDEHPNKITQLLYFLVYDKLQEAEEWTKNIAGGYEKETAESLVKDYKDGKLL